MLCYCKSELQPGDRVHVMRLDTDWGAGDIRPPAEGKSAAFCSFACLSRWASEKSVEHDARVLVDGTDEAFGNAVAPVEQPVVTANVDRVVR